MSTVAVVVRTKDRPRLLRRALESITSQTFLDWQCIIVNDGGNPATVDALVADLPDDTRQKITVLHHESSRGRWKSANAGVLAATAPLLVLHDDDDAWDPRFLAACVEYLDRHPEADGVVSRIEIVWEEERDGALVETGREVFQPDLQDVLLSDTLLFNRFVPIAFVYRRALHEELGLYNDELPVVGDWDFNLKVLSRGPLSYVSPEPLAYWHQRTGAEGSDGNSVIANRGDHGRYDARIRDEALRDHVDANGLGLALYLTAFIDRRFVEVENGIRDAIGDASALRRVSRTVKRVTTGRRKRRDS